jgi:beta-barrel assembly-enhancing protease
VKSRGIRPEAAYSSRTVSGGSRVKCPISPIRSYARLVICSTCFLFCVEQMCASDADAHRIPKAAEEAASAASPIAQPAPVSQERTEKAGKYDVSRIGQRSIGHGVNVYSAQKERSLGETMASSIDRGAKFVADPQVNDYISRLSQKIARNSDAQVIFTTKVIDSPDLRIFALPGGFLYVDKGLIMEVDSEAELAGLMAHEIAHVAARHATRFATRKYVWSMLSIPITYLSGPAAIGTRQIAPLTLKKFSRDAEFEADLLGIQYQYAAGYDPQTFVEALEKLQSCDRKTRERIAKGLPGVGKAALGGPIARAFASYPPTEERIEKAQTQISTLLPGRNDYVLDTSEFQEVKAKLAWADRPILRRHRAGDGPTNGPVLHRQSQQYDLAGTSNLVTKGRLSSVFSYLPAFPY